MAPSLTSYMVTVPKECCAIQRGTRQRCQKDVFLKVRAANVARRFKVSFFDETL